MRKINDITGKRSGKLVAVSLSGRDGRGYIWKCICDCGNECEAAATQINKQKKRSCGCMVAAPKDISGDRYGYLTAKERLHKSSNGDYFWLCICDCGAEKITTIGRLRFGWTKSCGCMSDINKGTHHMSKSPEYRAWCHMKGRCYDPNDKFYNEYGERGIIVCERWKNSFENFYDDMGIRPKGTSIDRKNNDGSYEPENCRWATNAQQSYNRRGSKNSAAGYKGVTIKKDKFRACITKDGTRYHIGYYDTAEEAAVAYNNKAIELFGEYCCLNKIQNNY